MFHASHTNLDEVASPGGVKSKLALSFALASKNVSIVSASVSDTSNLRLNIKIYYKFSNKIPSTYRWYSLEKNKEFIPNFTKKIFRQVSTLF